MDTNIRVLIIDDFPTMRRIEKTILSDLGFGNIQEAEDGLKAMDLLKTEKFELIITDWNMPKLSGVELVKIIRAGTSKNKWSKILMVTSEAKKEQIIEAAQAGVDGYILKPFTPDIFHLKLEKLFSKE